MDVNAFMKSFKEGLINDGELSSLIPPLTEDDLKRAGVERSK